MVLCNPSVDHRFSYFAAGYFYNVHNRTKRTWEDSRRTCIKKGQDLISISSEEEQKHIESKIMNKRADYWIGLNDRMNESNFVWSDGARLVYTNWASREPNNAGGQYEQDCGQLWSKRNFMWDDDSCSSKKFFICKGGMKWIALC